MRRDDLRTSVWDDNHAGSALRVRVLGSMPCSGQARTYAGRPYVNVVYEDQPGRRTHDLAGTGGKAAFTASGLMPSVSNTKR
jgi:hypothetical protein